MTDYSYAFVVRGNFKFCVEWISKFEEILYYDGHIDCNAVVKVSTIVPPWISVYMSMYIKYANRFLDFVLSLFGMIVLWRLFLVIIIAMKIDWCSSIFFKKIES